MAKGQKRNSREAKKPKASKKPAATPAEARNALTAKFTTLKTGK